MKKFKSFVAILLVACMLMALTACGGNKTYKVTVKDALGNPYTAGVVVNFMQNGEKVGMQACDENGVATKKLPKSEYTVSLSFTDSEIEYYYDENATVTASENEIDLILAYKTSDEPTILYVGAEELDAYAVSVGCTYVELTNEHRNYFLFTPKEAGNYEFSVIGDAKTEIGYFGAPHFVQENNVAEVVNNKFTISVSASMIGSGEGGTSTYVIGIDALDANSKNCVLAVKRLGDAIKTLEDEPWTVYQKTVELSEYTLPAGAQIKEFDLTASTDTYKLVLNETDGFYHLNSANGPLVLVRLAEDCDYIACFETMLDRSGVSKYFFDENDEFVKKESYSECLLEYIEYVDEAEGVYPLTEDLKYIIQQRGEYVGWWNIESSGYIFKDSAGNNDATINAEIAWLLMCCYID